MMIIEIETMLDQHDCETCGGNYAEGGIVKIDGRKVLRKGPFASCYGAPSFTESDLLVMALKKMGVEVLVDGQQYQICSHDDDYYGYKLEDN